MSSALISQISKLGFNVSQEWLDACIEFCQSQIPAPTAQALLNAVIEQWMNADISVEDTQAGPQIQRTFSQDVPKGPPLEGKFCLQVNMTATSPYQACTNLSLSLQPWKM